METTDRARQVVSDLFTRYLDDATQPPDAHASAADFFATKRAQAGWFTRWHDDFAIQNTSA
jgi:hypothetical protein